MRFILARQMGAPTPAWFNTGLHWAYGNRRSPRRATIRAISRPASLVASASA